MAQAEADRQTVLAWGRASDPAVAGRAMYDLILLDLRPGLAGMTTPLTVVYPDNVPAGTKPGFMDGVIAGAFKGPAKLTLQRVDGSVHFVMFDQPQAFAAAVDAFLAD